MCKGIAIAYVDTLDISRENSLSMESSLILRSVGEEWFSSIQA